MFEDTDFYYFIASLAHQGGKFDREIWNISKAEIKGLF